MHGIEPGGKLGEQGLIVAFPLPAQFERLRQRCAFFVEFHLAKDGVRSGIEGGQIVRDPERRRLAIRVGRQNDAGAWVSLRQPGFGDIHRRATPVSRMRFRRRQPSFDHANIETQTFRQRPRKGSAVVGAIVREDDHANRFRIQSASPVILLRRQRHEAVRQAIRLILDGNGDSDGS